MGPHFVDVSAQSVGLIHVRKDSHSCQSVRGHGFAKDNTVRILNFSVKGFDIPSEKAAYRKCKTALSTAKFRTHCSCRIEYHRVDFTECHDLEVDAE